MMNCHTEGKGRGAGGVLRSGCEGQAVVAACVRGAHEIMRRALVECEPSRSEAKAHELGRGDQRAEGVRLLVQQPSELRRLLQHPCERPVHEIEPDEREPIEAARGG